MLFNSFVFIFLFFPVVLLGYYGWVRLKWGRTCILWLVLASLVFYAWWRAEYLGLLLGSILFNYLIGVAILKNHQAQRPQIAKRWLIAGITGDLLLLGYYKYSHFLLHNLGKLFPNLPDSAEILLPLGISFFTFTQIAYLVDTHSGKAKEYSFSKYLLLVTYFPHLIAGPILHHRDMIPQFNLSVIQNSQIFKNMYYGLLIFLIGLFKKVAIADTFAVFATKGFDEVGRLYFLEGWLTSLAYTFQLFFDFSGYSDMAVGISLMLQIRLPLNFNSPYTALNIQDFWRRWHITLSNFLRDYIYIPLGGNQRGPAMTYLNLMITFLIGGIWHGAGWLFLLWGALHGLGLVIHRQFRTWKIALPTWSAWLLTFLFVNFAWIFFRAERSRDAFKVIKGMLGLNGWSAPQGDIFTWHMLLEQFQLQLHVALFDSTGFTLLALGICSGLAVLLTVRSANDLAYRLTPSWPVAAGFSLLTLYVLLKLNKPSEFLYFNF